MLIAHAAVRSTNTFFSMSLFALLMPQSTFDNLCLHLENWLIDEDSHPDIADFLFTGLTSWFEDPFGTEPVILSTIPSIRQVASTHFFAVL